MLSEEEIKARIDEEAAEINAFMEKAEAEAALKETDEAAAEGAEGTAPAAEEKTEAGLKCPECGAALKPENKFCDSCGAPVK